MHYALARRFVLFHLESCVGDLLSDPYCGSAGENDQRSASIQVRVSDARTLYEG